MIFVSLAGAAALCAIGVVAFKNAVRSALCLVLNFFLLAFLYFSLNAEMLGITQIVVYTGAIMVLFLFVIMLLNLTGANHLEEKQDPKKIAGIGLGVGLAGLVASQLIPAFLKTEAQPIRFAYGEPQSIGKVLFTTYVLPFEAVSILLLVGLVGSILLAKRRIS